MGAGLLSALIVFFFAVLSAWRFYHEQIDVLDDDAPAAETAQQRAEAAGEVRELVGAYLLAVPVIVSLAAGSAWILAGRLTRPLTKLARTADLIGEGTLHERLPEEQGVDEVRRLARVLNRMLDRLARSLEQARRFTADASHELRTPLAVMRAQLELALQNDPTGPWAGTLGALLEDNQRLAAIVEKLMLLARADAGKLAVQMRIVKLGALVEDILGDVEILASEREVRLVSNITPDLAVMGDDALLRQLILNLCDNAVKYNVPGGRIEVRLQSQREAAVLVVANTGMPIPKHLRSRLFERFFRADESRERPWGGAGLGLSLCKEIASAHRGRLELVSSDEKETIFQASLPLSPPAA